MQLKQTHSGVFQGYWTVFKTITFLHSQGLCEVSRGWRSSLPESMVEPLVLFFILSYGFIVDPVLL